MDMESFEKYVEIDDQVTVRGLLISFNLERV
ncbi:hypothetical protein HNR44_002515 [Geomicrobium halophilum]|uniref:Uncharacterized protein n=1 Tax=Geomicrobium halophilum TaxID=549000 RepID=A0A841PZZ6_9BACL|nr:hypothetical protein [Geomicrobium halophilum]